MHPNMDYKEFKKGLKITCGDDTGEVNFIDKMYITLTTHRWKKPPELAEGSCYPYGEVNLLCNNKYWDELELQSNTEEQQSSSAMYKSQEGRYIDP